MADREPAGRLRRAAAAGDIDAVRDLGIQLKLLEDLGRLHEAEWWYRRAIDAGDAASNARVRLDAGSFGSPR